MTMEIGLGQMAQCQGLGQSLWKCFLLTTGGRSIEATDDNFILLFVKIFHAA